MCVVGYVVRDAVPHYVPCLQKRTKSWKCNNFSKERRNSLMRPSLRSIRRTPSQLHSLQQIPTQHDMLPQHLVYKNELNREYGITLARNDETPWWWSEKFETCRSGFKCFKWKLYSCICWLIVEVISRNARCNDEIHFKINIKITLTCSYMFRSTTITRETWLEPS